LAAKLGVIAHLTGHLRQGAQESQQLIELLDFGYVTDIALDDCIEVLSRPRHAAPGRGTQNHFRVAAAHHALDHFIAHCGPIVLQ